MVGTPAFQLFPEAGSERARAHGRAELPDGFKVKISCNSSDQQRKDFVRLSRPSWRPLILMSKLMLWTAPPRHRLAAGEGELSIYGYTASTGEAGRVLFRWLPDKSEWPIFSWESPEYYDLINEALVTIDHDARNGCSVISRAPDGKLCGPARLAQELNAACQPYVRGFRIMPSYEHHLLQYVYEE